MSKITISDLKNSNVHLIEELSNDDLKNISGGATFYQILGGIVTGGVVGGGLAGPAGLIGGAVLGGLAVALKD